MTRVLEIVDLRMRFRTPAGLLRAVDGVTLHVEAGETLGLVGESGCGKSTLARCVVGVHAPTEGRVSVGGLDAGARPDRLARARLAQMVFQDPSSSLNPRKTVERIVEEPLLVHGVGARAERRKKVSDLLGQVGLADYHRARRAHELSGGQRQRVSIARALALEPRLVVCDEPVSALDVSVQAQILNLFLDLQKRLGLAYLFISHDLAVIRYVSRRIAVMYLGRIVETGETETVWRRRLHPYTRGLIDAIPGEAAEGQALRFEGDVPSPINPPSGCTFRTRCPFAREICAREAPALKAHGEGHAVACHFAGDPLLSAPLTARAPA